MAAGDRITADEYNRIRNKIADVLGIGAGQFGYGQSLQSSTVSIGETITKQQIDNLRFDIYNSLFHQTGITPSLITKSVGDVITYSATEPVFQYETAADTARLNRFDLGTGQFSTSLVVDTTTPYTANWNSQLSCTCTVTFATAEEARFYFNSGGKIRFTSERTGTQASLQDGAWTTFLDGLGNIDFTAATADARFTRGFYNLTNSAQTVFDETASSPYGANRLRIQSQCDIADNSSGGARIITFTINWIDGYNDPGGGPPPGDLVTGTFSADVKYVFADGTLQPAPTAGAFTVDLPTSSVFSAISGS